MSDSFGSLFSHNRIDYLKGKRIGNMIRDYYEEKVGYMLECEYKELLPREYYRWMFPTNSFQKNGEARGDYKPNALLQYHCKSFKTTAMSTCVVFDDHEIITECIVCDRLFAELYNETPAILSDGMNYEQVIRVIAQHCDSFFSRPNSTASSGSPIVSPTVFSENLAFERRYLQFKKNADIIGKDDALRNVDISDIQIFAHRYTAV